MCTCGDATLTGRGSGPGHCNKALETVTRKLYKEGAMRQKRTEEDDLEELEAQNANYVVQMPPCQKVSQGYTKA